jgi:hypothetical protein
MPVATSSGIANAHHFGMRGGISGLHAAIVTTRDYAASAVGEHGAYGQTTLAEPQSCFRESFPE